MLNGHVRGFRFQYLSSFIYVVHIIIVHDKWLQFNKSGKCTIEENGYDSAFKSRDR